jgi:hypothetical protein
LDLIIAEFEALLILSGDFEKSFARLQPFLIYPGYLMLFVLPEKNFWPLSVGMA